MGNINKTYTKDEAFKVLDLVNESIKHTDNKSAILVGLITLLIGLTTKVFEAVNIISNWNNKVLCGFLLFLFILYCVAVALSIIFSSLVFISRYVTNKGQIFERVSSGSFVVKDSAKLSQIYYKREEQLKNTELKLSLEPIKPNKIIVENLCGYLDFGFSTVYSDETTLKKGFAIYNFQPLCNFLNSKNISHSVSRLGTSILISYGNIGINPYLLSSGFHNFVEIMADGSVKGRIILVSFGQSNEVKVDIQALLAVTKIFKKIYSMIFDESHFKSFIYALKYEKLTVLKQFIPYYNLKNVNGALIFNDHLNKHKEKYGNNLIVNSGRYPYVGLKTIDKKYFDEIKVKYNYDNLLNYLFPVAFATLGYIDPIKSQ